MKIKRKFFISLLFISVLFIFPKMYVNAADATISVSNTNPKPGEKVTVTGSATAGAWNLNLSGNGKSETIYGYTNTNENSTGTKSITFTAGDEGETYIFSLTGGMTDINSESEETVNKETSIVVAKNSSDKKINNQKSTTKSNTSEKASSSDNTDTNNNDEPVFTDVNQKAKVTDKINFRSSYSTKSASIGKIKKGETVSVIANGDNGWSKINYNKKTGYVKTEFLSIIEETEIEEQEKQDVENYFGLSVLKIKNNELNPEFRTDIYEYTIKTTDKITELDIEQAIATSQTAKVEIAGNENFKIGENIVTINISDKKSKDSAMYTLKVYLNEKEEVNEEPNQTVYNEEIDRIQKELNIKKWIIRGIIISVVTIIIIMCILRYNTVKEDEEKQYNRRDGYVIIDEKFDSDEKGKEKIAQIEQFDEELEQIKDNDKNEDIIIKPRRMKKTKGKHF